MAEGRFIDRVQAGRLLAEEVVKLDSLVGKRGKISVLGLPRGGVMVAAEVAHVLKAPLDVFVVRKIGVPYQRELALGAVASGGVSVFNEEILSGIDLPKEKLNQIVEEEKKKLLQQEKGYRRENQLLDLKNRSVILVDDGLATGATMLAAVQALRCMSISHLVVAIPIAPLSACEKLRPHVDEVICLLNPEPFHAVGTWYENFEQITDGEVCAILEKG